MYEIESHVSFLAHVNSQAIGINFLRKSNHELDEIVDKRTDIIKSVNEKTVDMNKLHTEYHDDQLSMEAHVEEAERKLNELRFFGKELISNIDVSTEKYELMRRQAEEIQKDELDEKINNERKITMAKFDEILARWSELGDVKEPMALFEELEELKKKVGQLMDSKKTIIEKCKEEYLRLTEQYEVDQARHELSMCCLVERIDNHVEIMNQAYKNQIETLSLLLDNERKQKLIESEAEWRDVFYKSIESQNKNQLLQREKKEYYANELKQITRKQEEMTHATRVRLERDAELLQLELRKAHNNALLNSEKLDYNYNVLQNSSLEKTVILNQQKRRIASLSEHIVQIKKQITEQKQRNEVQIVKAVADVEKLHSSISSLEEKGQGLQKYKNHQYLRCWDMNYNEAVELIEKIFAIDKTIHEQQLLVPWKPLKIEPLYKSPANNKEMPKTSHSSTKNDIMKKRQEKKKRKHLNVLNEAEAKLIRQVLRSLPGRTGFLIESPLHAILKSYSEKDKNIIKIDNVFSALKIYNIKDMRTMAKYFKPYMYCPNCTKKLSDEMLNSVFGDEYIFPEYTDKECPNHYLVMDPSVVLTALNEFMEVHREEIEAKGYDSTNYSGKASQILNMSNREIEEFWKKLESNVPKTRYNLWKAVEHGLNHYMVILKKREQLFKECNTLKRQNFELKHFLKRFH